MDFPGTEVMPIRHRDMTVADAMEVSSQVNREFVAGALRTVFRPEVLGRGEFLSEQVVSAARDRGLTPTDWRVIGPLMKRAETLGIVRRTGRQARRLRYPLTDPTGRNGHSGPTYVLVRR